jgi:hypothetical protein
LSASPHPTPNLFPLLNKNGMSFRIPRTRDEESLIKID